MIVHPIYSNVSSSFARNLSENYIEGTGIFYDSNIAFNKVGLQAQKKEVAQFLVNIGIAEMDRVPLTRILTDKEGKHWMTVRNDDNDILSLNSFIAYLNALDFIGESQEIYSGEKPQPIFSSTVFLLRRNSPLYIMLLKRHLKAIHFPVKKENILNAINEQEPPTI